jgi:hypothetical protein
MIFHLYIFGVAGRCSLKALIAFFYPSSIAHPSIRQKERKPFSLSRSKNPKKGTAFLPAPPKVVKVSLEQKGFSCHFNERLRYKISFRLWLLFFASAIINLLPGPVVCS